MARAAEPIPPILRFSSSASETRGNLARDIGHVVPFQAHSRLCFESRVANTFAIFAASSRVVFRDLEDYRAPHDSHSIVSLATLAQPRARTAPGHRWGLANHVPVLNVGVALSFAVPGTALAHDRGGLLRAGRSEPRFPGAEPSRCPRRGRSRGAS